MDGEPLSEVICLIFHEIAMLMLAAKDMASFESYEWTYEVNNYYKQNTQELCKGVTQIISDSLLELTRNINWNGINDETVKKLVILYS